jgi:RNA methyltransferase, TrmH family
MKITSLQNTVIKNIVKLKDKSSERSRQNLFVIEGAREIRLAFESGYDISQFFYFPELSEKYLHEFDYKKNIPDSKRFEISSSVYEKIAYREGTEGMIVCAVLKTGTLGGLQLKKNPLLIVLEGVEKPGNLGAILRTADAADVDAVIICDPKTDFYNPNVIRSSVGCVFTRQTAACSTDELLIYLKKNNITTFAAELKASVQYHTADFTKPMALVFGTEALGLSAKWIDASDHRIIIPMSGKIDSLNVAASAAIIIFEAKRQRDFK